MSEVLEVQQADSADDFDVPEVKGPLVFSCAKCRTLIGDSYSFLTSNEENRTITLASSSNIQRSADVYTSKSGNDVGSTYFNFTCLNCQTLLGRYYLTTSRDMDSQRERFTFNVDAITSYELGKAQHGKMPEPAGDDEDDSSGSKGDASGLDAAALSAERFQELQDMKATIAGFSDNMNGLNGELLKVQQVLFGVLGRIEGLEVRQGQGQGQGEGRRSAGGTPIRADQWLQVGPQQRSYGSPDKTNKRLRRGA